MVLPPNGPRGEKKRSWNRHEPVKLMLDAVIAVITKGEKYCSFNGDGHARRRLLGAVSGEVEAGGSQEAALARDAMK